MGRKAGDDRSVKLSLISCNIRIEAIHFIIIRKRWVSTNKGVTLTSMVMNCLDFIIKYNRHLCSSKQLGQLQKYYKIDAPFVVHIPAMAECGR